MQATRNVERDGVEKVRMPIHMVYDKLSTSKDANHYVRGLNDLDGNKAAHRALGRIHYEILPFYGYEFRNSDEAANALTTAVMRAVALKIRRDRIYRTAAEAAIEILGGYRPGYNGGGVEYVEDDSYDERVIRAAARAISDLR